LPPGRYEGPYIEALFTNTLDASAHPSFQAIAGLRVSAHLLIRRGGEMIQFVPFIKRAWHAGKSCFAGRSSCNDFSIGIELEGDDHTAYTDAQYERLVDVASSIRRTWPRITPQRIVGHSDVAPGRKTDPGPAFDWERFCARLARHDAEGR
jgi:AmpD protein